MKRTAKTTIILSLISIVVLLALSASPVLAKDGKDAMTPMKKLSLQKALDAENNDEKQGDPYVTGNKSKSFARRKAFSVGKAQGKLSFKLVSAKIGKKSHKNKFKVNKKTGKITVKQNTKQGTYKVKVRVKANGNANYKASAWKTVTFKVKVK